MPDRKKFLQDFYSKYAPETQLTDERLKAIDTKYGDNDEQLITDLYGKYAADQELSSERLTAISTKYGLKKKSETVSQPGSEAGQIGSSPEKLPPGVDVSPLNNIQIPSSPESNPDQVRANYEKQRKEKSDLKDFLLKKGEYDPSRQAMTQNQKFAYDNFGVVGGGLYDLGRKVKSFAVNDIPALLENMNPEDFGGPGATRAMESLKKSGVELKGTTPEAQAERFKKAKIQRLEGQEELRGIPQTWEEAKKTGSTGVASYIGSALGMGLSQMPLAVGTIGTSSFYLEKDDAYNEAVEAIAKELDPINPNPEQVIAQGLDKPAKRISNYVGAVNAVLERIGAGKALAPLRGLIQKDLLSRGMNIGEAALTEYVTERTQDFNTQIGSLVASGKKLEDIDLGTDIDWKRNRESGRQGALAGGGLSTASNIIANGQKGKDQGVEAGAEVPGEGLFGTGQEGEDKAGDNIRSEPDKQEQNVRLQPDKQDGNVRVQPSVSENTEKPQETKPQAGRVVPPTAVDETATEGGDWVVGDVLEESYPHPKRTITEILGKMDGGSTKVKFDNGTMGAIGPKSTYQKPTKESTTESVDETESDILAKYEEGEKNIYDIVDELDGSDNQAIQDAVNEFRNEQEYDRSISGRHDMEMVEQNFINKIKPLINESRNKQSGRTVSDQTQQQPNNPPAAQPSASKTNTEVPGSEGVNREVGEVKGFTEAKDLNKIWAGLKTKYGEKKGAAIYDAAKRLVNINENTIVEIRSNGVVVKEGDKYTLKPFGNTDANSKKWTLYKGIDVSDQFQMEESPVRSLPPTATAENAENETGTKLPEPVRNEPQISETAPKENYNAGSKVEFIWHTSDTPRTGTITAITPDRVKIKDEETGKTYPVSRDKVGKVVGFVNPLPPQFGLLNIPTKQLKAITSWLKDKFYERGLFNKPSWNLLKKGESNINAEAVRMNINVGKVKSAIEQDFPGSKQDLEFVDAVLHGEIPFEKLPKRTRNAVQKYRNHIEQLQAKGFEVGAFEGIEETIRNNENYVTRSYAINDIPDEFKNWLREDPEGQAIYNQAVMYMDQKLNAEAMKTMAKATRLRDRAKNLPKTIQTLENRKQKIRDAFQFTARTSPQTVREQSIKRDEAIKQVDDLIQNLKSRDFNAEADALEQSGRKLMAQDATATVEAILAEKDPAKAIISGGRAGAMDVGVLKKRQDIDKPIRELFGEYKDPNINYMKTVSKLASLVYNYEFQNKIRQDGLGKYLFEKPVGNYTSKIAPEGSDSVRGLTQGKELYTTKELADAFNNYRAQDSYIPVLSQLIKLNALATYAKTVLTPATHVRNFIGAGMMASFNGNLFAGSGWSQAAKSSLADLTQKTTDQMDEYLVDLARRGVIHEGSVAGTMRDYAKDAYGLSPDEFVLKTAGNVGKLKSNSLKVINRMYRLEDDFWKVLQYENELSRFKQNNTQNLTEEQLKEKAALYVRRGNSVYSLTPKAINWIRRFPFFSSFPTFPYQVARATYGTVLNIQQDLKEGNNAAAAKRIAGLAGIYGSTFALVALGMSQSGVDEDEDKALNSFLPPWSVGGQKFYIDFDRENDKIKFVDMTYSDPLASYKKIISGGIDSTQEGEVTNELASSLFEFFRPFYDEEVLTRKIIDIMRNKDSNLNRPIFNGEDKQLAMTQILQHLYKGLEPGALKSVDAIIKASNGEVSRTGKEYSVADELIYNLAGQKVETIDLRKNLGFALKTINRRLQDAGYIEESGAGQEREDAAVQSILADGRKIIKDARALGVDESAIYEAVVKSFRQNKVKAELLN